MSTNNPGSPIFKFVWEISTLGIKDTLQDSLFKLSFNDTGNYRIVVYAINQKNLISDSDTFIISVFLKPPEKGRPIVKSIHDTTVFVNASVILHATGIDSNGTIKKYLWSFDGVNFDTTTDSTTKKVWGSSEQGQKTLIVKVIDNDGLVSEIDSTHINVLSSVVKTITPDYFPFQIGNVWVYEIIYNAPCTSYETVKTILDIEAISKDTTHSQADYWFRIVSRSKLTPRPGYGIPNGKDTLEHIDTQFVAYYRSNSNLYCKDTCNTYINDLFNFLETKYTKYTTLTEISFNNNLHDIFIYDNHYFGRFGYEGPKKFFCNQIGLIFMQEIISYGQSCGYSETSVKLVSFNSDVMNYENTYWLCNLKDSCNFIGTL